VTFAKTVTPHKSFAITDPGTTTNPRTTATASLTHFPVNLLVIMSVSFPLRAGKIEGPDAAVFGNRWVFDGDSMG
jgi:hypothetical protein